MIGGILGIGLVISYLATAWSGPGDGDTLFNGGFVPGLVVIFIRGILTEIITTRMMARKGASA